MQHIDPICEMTVTPDTAAGKLERGDTFTMRAGRIGGETLLGLILSPMIASAAMIFSSVSVILNALRLRNLKL